MVQGWSDRRSHWVGVLIIGGKLSASCHRQISLWLRRPTVHMLHLFLGQNLDVGCNEGGFFLKRS